MASALWIALRTCRRGNASPGTIKCQQYELQRVIGLQTTQAKKRGSPRGYLEVASKSRLRRVWRPARCDTPSCNRFLCNYCFQQEETYLQANQINQHNSGLAFSRFTWNINHTSDTLRMYLITTINYTLTHATQHTTSIVNIALTLAGAEHKDCFSGDSLPLLLRLEDTECQCCYLLKSTYINMKQHKSWI
jgi:hypothetical protein